MSFVELTPLDCDLKVDQQFTDFVKKKLDGQSVEKGGRINLRGLILHIKFGVTDCVPFKATIDKTMTLRILEHTFPYHSILNPFSFSSLETKTAK